MAENMSFDTWAASVARELTRLGVPMFEANHVPYDNEDWFRREYEDGQDAGMTAAEWFNNAPQE